MTSQTATTANVFHAGEPVIFVAGTLKHSVGKIQPVRSATPGTYTVWIAGMNYGAYNIPAEHLRSLEI